MPARKPQSQAKASRDYSPEPARLEYIKEAAMNCAAEQDFGPDPVAVRDTEHYRLEYVLNLAQKWDELIDWRRRAEGEGDFFKRLLSARGARRVLDVATGTGFHSVTLMAAGFDVVSADGSPAMLAKAVDNAQNHGLELNPVHGDWRSLGRELDGGFDAIVCLGNSFTHLFNEPDRLAALDQFRRLLAPGGALIIDQRNYDAILDNRYHASHRYNYCGEHVCVEPEHVDEGLARFRYAFPDNTVYHLNMYPLRLDYLLGLIDRTGFGRVTTYGDFSPEFDQDQTEFFIHVAERD